RSRNTSLLLHTISDDNNFLERHDIRFQRDGDYGLISHRNLLVYVADIREDNYVRLTGYRQRIATLHIRHRTDRRTFDDHRNAGQRFMSVYRRHRPADRLLLRRSSGNDTTPQEQPQYDCP